MEFKKLAFELLKIIKAGGTIYPHSYPSDTYFDSKSADEFRKISGYSNKEGLFSKSKGSVGIEYALQLLYFIDEIYVTNPISGSSDSVNVRSGFSAKPSLDQEHKKLAYELEVGGKKYSTKKYETKNIEGEGLVPEVAGRSEKDGFIYGFVSTVHTHPKFYHEGGGYNYSFFSPQDIATLVYGGTPTLGLIAGSNIWLGCRTNESKPVPGELLYKASEIELKEGNEKLKSFVRNELKDFGIIFYFGSLSGKLTKV